MAATTPMIAALRYAMHEPRSRAERDDSSALAIGGFMVAMLDRDFATALNALDQSLALNSNSALAYGFSAMVRAMHDDHDRAIEHAERALRLSPFDPLRKVPQMALAVAYFFSGNFERAAAVAADARIGSFDTPYTWPRRSAWESSTKRVWRRRGSLRLSPDFTVAGFERTAQSHPFTARIGCGHLQRVDRSRLAVRQWP